MGFFQDRNFSFIIITSDYKVLIVVKSDKCTHDLRVSTFVAIWTPVGLSSGLSP